MGTAFTIENILDMLEAAITQPPSQATLAKLQETGATGDSASIEAVWTEETSVSQQDHPR
jgi:hypothetical protein